MVLEKPIWLPKNRSIWKRWVSTQLLLIYTGLIKPKFTQVTFCRGAKYIVLNFNCSKVVSQSLDWVIESNVVLENDISGVRKQYDCLLACKPLLHLSIYQFKEKRSGWTVDWGKDSYRYGQNSEHSTLIFENLKPVEKSKNHFSIIWTSSKVVLIFKIRRVRLKN